MVTDLRDPRKALSSIAQYFKREFSLTGNQTQNQTRLESNGFVFYDYIAHYTVSGNIVNLNELSDKERLNVVKVCEPFNTHTHGREYHNRVARIGGEIGLEYAPANTIIRKLFGADTAYSEKLLAFPPRDLYAFVINNFDLLRRTFREAMASELAQVSMSPDMVSERQFTIPQSTLFTYNIQSKVQTISEKNVYQGYLLSAEPRSSGEKKFEKYCEDVVDWIYKNGDKGDEYFSIVYTDNSNRQKLFYPDYIVSLHGEIWIIETKGGFSQSGDSEDIDIYSPKKFEVLKKYLAKHNLKGGFVRYDKESEELCISVDSYDEDIHSANWQLLREVLK